MNLEEAALENAKVGYSKFEIEHRVKSISIVANLASAYGIEFEGRGGGIVLGMEVDEKYLATIPPQFSLVSKMSQTTKLFSILLILLLLIPLSHALSLDTEPSECQTVDFYKPSTWISCGLAKIKNLIK